MIDRRGDQLGKVLVCVHAVTIQHRGRATRSIDHNTHGHRLGQYKAQAGFEGSQEAGALDEEVAIASTPSSVRLVSSLLIDWVDDIEIILGLLRGVQIYEPDEVRIETSRSGDHKRQKTEITRKKIVEVAMFWILSRAACSIGRSRFLRLTHKVPLISFMLLPKRSCWSVRSMTKFRLSLSTNGCGKYASSSMSPRCLRLGPTPVTRICVRTVFPKDRNKAATCATAQSCDFAAPP